MSNYGETAIDLAPSELYPSRLPTLLADVAIRLGIDDLTEPELRSMQVIPFITRHVDDHVDIPPFPEAVDDIVAELIAGHAVPEIGVGEIQAETFGELYNEHLDPTQQDTLLRVLRTLPAFAREHREAKTMDALIACRLEECFGFASIMTLRSSSHDSHKSQKRRVRYNTWMRSISRAGYLIDTLTDLNRDRAAGRVNFTPTLKEVRHLAKLTGSECLIHYAVRHWAPSFFWAKRQ